MIVVVVVVVDDYKRRTAALMSLFRSLWWVRDTLHLSSRDAVNSLFFSRPN